MASRDGAPAARTASTRTEGSGTALGGRGGAAGAPGAGGAKVEGRRERKKRETRQRISDIATGLFLARGFAAVTVAEVAEAADVSVNTVYNYFPAKEDLFFDREEEIVDRASRAVRGRAPGESAADAVLGMMRHDISAHNMYGGMTEGYEQFMRCVREAPSLMARAHVMQQRTADRLAATLREETGDPPDDPTPDLVAGQLTQLSNDVFRSTTSRMAQGASRERVAAEGLRRIDVFEALMSERLLRYATRSGA